VGRSAPLGSLSITAVIFDCDGVLVDSEALSVSALLGMIEIAGGSVGEDAAGGRRAPPIHRPAGCRWDDLPTIGRPEATRHGRFQSQQRRP